MAQDDDGVRAPTAAPPPAGTGPAWFTAMDTNRDLELSPREFLGSQKQFTLLDTSGDGFIGVDEAQTGGR